MAWMTAWLLTFGLVSAEATIQKIETYQVPHWISLLPTKIEQQISGAERSANIVAREKCAKEREEFWELQLKASELGANTAANEDYIAAADLAGQAGEKERACLRTHAKADPLKFEFDLHIEPDVNSKKIGKLRMEIHPWVYGGSETETQVKLFFVDLENVEKEFLPDIVGPHADKPSAYHTVSARQGDWIKLPKRPFPSPVWLSFANLGDARPLSILKIARPVFVSTGETGTYVVFQTQKQHQMVGVESDEDRGKTPAKGKTVTVNLADLFDPDGHIRAKWRAED